MAPRSYELGTFRGNVEQEEESDDAYRSSIAELTDRGAKLRGAKLRGAKLGEFILKMRMYTRISISDLTSGRLRGRCYRRPRVCDQRELNQEGSGERKTLCVQARTTAVSAASGPLQWSASSEGKIQKPRCQYHMISPVVTKSDLPTCK
jgi:hypothetical protein